MRLVDVYDNLVYTLQKATGLPGRFAVYRSHDYQNLSTRLDIIWEGDLQNHTVVLKLDDERLLGYTVEELARDFKAGLIKNMEKALGGDYVVLYAPDRAGRKN